MSGSETTTDGVRVRVEPQFHPEESSPESGFWFFSYRVEIINEGDRAVRLVSRHWVIEDAMGHEEHVRGPGVVGQQPFLQPGESFEYRSACPLPTSMGTMKGSYRMLLPDGEHFDAEIAAFTLVDPMSVN